MSVFVISDTHLSLAQDKPMDIFGNRWINYTEKIKERWNETVKSSDTVVIAGDISWAMDLDGAFGDFEFLDSLPGKKIIGRGNHDYWWATVTKMNRFAVENGFHTLNFLYNNAYVAEDYIICGSRGWFPDEKTSPKDSDYDKIIAHEVLRLTMSIEAAENLCDGDASEYEKAVFLHFPPYYGGYVCRAIIDVLHAYNINLCFYGHIHGQYDIPQVSELEGIEFVLTSADFMNFRPLRMN